MDHSEVTNIQGPNQIEITDSFPLMIIKVLCVVTILLTFIIYPFARFIADKLFL